MRHPSLTVTLLLAALLCGVQLPAQAATSAGTQVVNTASASWKIKGIAQAPKTASADFVVAQRINVSLDWQDSTPVVMPAGATGVLTFKITNTGNGTDQFGLQLSAGTPASPAFTTSGCQIFLDSDQDGKHTAADPQYVPGNNAPQLAAGASESLFVICRTPSSTANGSNATEILKAASNTLTGINKDKSITVAGHSTWAVTDSTAGKASADGHYVSISPAFDFPLTQSVRDPDNGSQVVPGSVITYTMKVTPKGSSTAYQTQVTDPIPDHTHYKPGSLTLDGQHLTDMDDSDAGRFNATDNQIEVKLGKRQPSDPTQIITYQVTVDAITP